MPLLENPERYSKLLTSLNATPKKTEGDQNPISYNRRLSPIECSFAIEELITDLGSEDLTLKSLPIEIDMFNHFRRLQKISKKYQRSIVWNKTSEIGVAFSTAANIAKIKDQLEQDMVFESSIKYGLKKEETDHIVRLKNAKPELTIEECIEQIKQFRPDVVPSFYLVLNISNDLILKYSEKAKSENKELKELLKEIISKTLGNEITSISIKNNNLALNLNQNGFDKFETLRIKNNLDDENIIPFLLGELK